MNKAFLKSYLQQKPNSDNGKYIFVVSDEDLAIMIIAVGFKAVALTEKFSIEDFTSCVCGLENAATARQEYAFVLACSTKKLNDALENVLKSEYLQYQHGWQLFREREFLAKSEYQIELKEILTGFIKRFEGPGEDLQRQHDLAKFHILSDKGKPIKPFDAAIVSYIIDKIPLFILGGIPFIYDNGAYFPDHTGAHLCDLIKKLIIPELANYNAIKRIYNLFLIEPGLIRDYENINLYPESWICFKNCMYDGKTGETYPLDHKYYCINQIPWNYEPDIECSGEITEKFLKSAVQKDDRKTIYETFALYMTRDISFQKFLLLTGGRGTGKSVLLKIYSYLLGNKNISSVPLQKFEEKFYAIQLLGKLANVCGDLPGTALREVGVIKEITGGDTITDSYKGKDVVSFRPYARLIFSCNTVPVSLDEKSNAFFERLIIIRMDNRPDEPDRHLDEKILKEIPYIINQSMRHLKELYARNKIYESGSSIELVNELYEDSDSVRAFLNSRIVREENQKIRTKELFDAYKEFCGEFEREPFSRNNFYRNIKGKGIGKKTVHGVEYFSGIGWKSNVEGVFLEIDEDEPAPFD